MPFSSAHLPPGLTVPAEAAAAYETGLQAFEAGDYATAWVNFANFANTVGPVPAALANVAESAFMEQYFDEARQYFTMALAQPEVSELIQAVCHCYLGNCNAAGGQLEAAFEEYRQATALKPDYTQAWHTGGRCLLELRRDAEASEWFARAGAPRWQGVAAASAGQLEPALAALVKATQDHPDLPEAWLGRALVEAQLGQADAARASAQQVVGGGLVVNDFSVLDAAIGILNGKADFRAGIDLLLGRRPPQLDAQPGLEAISAQLGLLYPNQEPLALSQMMRNSPLDSVWVYSTPTHWHFVSLGFTELYEKESPNPAVSGWGFELSVRVARPPNDDEPPAWVAPLLFKLGRYVFNNKAPFDEGHHIDYGGPLDDGESPLTALAFAADPQLKPLQTPHGSVKFLAVVGLKPEERPDLKDGAEALLERMARENPLLVVRG